MPRRAKGTVTPKKVLSGPAPKVREANSRRGSTFAMATSMARTIRGNDTNPAANAAATQVNTTSTPNRLCRS